MEVVQCDVVELVEEARARRAVVGVKANTAIR
jgi:hypothetical protein